MLVNASIIALTTSEEVIRARIYDHIWKERNEGHITDKEKVARVSVGTGSVFMHEGQSLWFAIDLTCIMYDINPHIRRGEKGKLLYY